MFLMHATVTAYGNYCSDKIFYNCGSSLGSLGKHLYIAISMFSYICDWACESRAYLHKLHIFRKWSFSWSVLKIFMFCKLSLLSYWFVNMAYKLHCDSFCTFKRYCKLKFKNQAKFCVQICPIFAGPVTYVFIQYTGVLESFYF